MIQTHHGAWLCTNPKYKALPELRDRLTASGAEAVGNTPEAFTATIQGEMARMGKVIRDAHIRDE